MMEQWVEDSIERTTGRVLWGYYLLFSAVAILLTDEIIRWLGGGTLGGVVWFIVFFLFVLWITGAASKRSNPIRRFRNVADVGGDRE